MSLYRKYRPQTFDEMIGNESEIDAFRKILEKENRPHTYLFTGPSGCGKTTLARIAASKLGADELSISEINSADNRGIDTAREIIQQMRYVPAGSGLRIYIIDELHMTSKDWQNAMLKPLEDTPDHVYFFLCTTNPEKLAAAFKNRCTQVAVVAQDNEALYRYMRRIAKKEGLEVPKDIIRDIAENCDGSPRRALVLLEKVSEVDDERAMKDIITIGPEAEKETIELCRALIGKYNWKQVAEILTGLKKEDPEKVRRAVMGYMNSVLLKKANNQAAMTLECFSEPLYNTGFPGLTLACYQSIVGE